MKFANWLNTLFRIGTILNVPIYLDFTFFLGFGLFSVSLSTFYAGQPAARLLFGLLSVVLLYTSVLLHEFGHLLTARSFGIGSEKVTLFLFGGMASLKGLGNTPLQASLIAIAGPAVSASIALIVYFLLLLLPESSTGNPVVMLGLMKTLNTSLAVFNLLPVLPLDGGRLSVALIWRSKYRYFERGYYYAVRFVARFISSIVLVLAMGAWILLKGFNPYTLLLGYMIGLSLRVEYRDADMRTAFDRNPLGKGMSPIVETDLEVVDEYLRTLKAPFENHYVALTEQGKKKLYLIQIHYTDDLLPDETNASSLKLFEVKVADTVDAKMSVGEFLASIKQAPTWEFYVVTEGDKWIGITVPAILNEINNEYSSGFTNAEADVPKS